MGRLVNRAELAEFFGVSLVTVSTWTKQGMPYVQRGSKGQQWQFDTADIAKWREDRAVSAAVGDTGAADVDELKRRKLAAETAVAEIEAAKARGQVAEIAEYERQWRAVLLEFRGRMLQLPGRAAPQCMGVYDESELRGILLDEVEQALTVFAEDFGENDDDSDSEGGD